MLAHNVVLQSTNQQTESWDETYHILISYVRIFSSSKSHQISGITWISCRSSVPPTSWPMTTVAMALAKALLLRKPAMSPSRPESGKGNGWGGTFRDANWVSILQIGWWLSITIFIYVYL